MAIAVVQVSLNNIMTDLLMQKAKGLFTDIAAIGEQIPELPSSPRERGEQREVPISLAQKASKQTSLDNVRLALESLPERAKKNEKAACSHCGTLIPYGRILEASGENYAGLPCLDCLKVPEERRKELKRA